MLHLRVRLNTGHRTRQALWAAADQLAVSAANFLTSIVVARLLSPPDFAMYALYYLCALFAAALHRALITQPMNSFGASDSPSEMSMRYRAMLRITAAMNGAGVLAIAAVSFALGVPASVWLSAALFSCCLNFQELARRHQFTLGRIERAFWIDALAYWPTVPLLILLSAKSGGASPAIPFCVMSVVMGTSFVIGYGDTESRGTLSGRGIQNVLRQHWMASKWIVATQFLFFGSIQIFPFLLAALHNAGAVANYAAATSVLNVFNLLRLTLGNYLPSTAATAYHRDGMLGLRDYLLTVTMIALGLGLAMALALSLLAGQLSHLLYNDKYPQLPAILPLFAFLQLFSVVSTITNIGGLIIHRTHWIFLSYALSAIVSLTAGYWLVAHFALTGAVYAIGLGAGVAAIVQGANLLYHLNKDRRSSSDQAVPSAP